MDANRVRHLNMMDLSLGSNSPRFFREVKWAKAFRISDHPLTENIRLPARDGFPRYNEFMPIISPIVSDPDIQAGTPCFAGTRVPVRSLFDSLKRGRSVDYFLSQFPSVRRDQVETVLDRASEILSENGHAA